MTGGADRSPACRRLIRMGVLELAARLENSSSCVNKQHATEEGLRHSASPQCIFHIIAGRLKIKLPHDLQRSGDESAHFVLYNVHCLSFRTRLQGTQGRPDYCSQLCSPNSLHGWKQKSALV